MAAGIGISVLLSVVVNQDNKTASDTGVWISVLLSVVENQGSGVMGVMVDVFVSGCFSGNLYVILIVMVGDKSRRPCVYNISTVAPRESGSDANMSSIS